MGKIDLQSLSENNKSLTPLLAILSEVSTKYGVSPREVMGRSKEEPINSARIAYYLRAVDETNASISSIGRRVGRDRSTVAKVIRRHYPSHRGQAYGGRA